MEFFSSAERPPPLGPDEDECEVLVIGAGIIGISIALRLQQQGHQVLVIDRSGVAAEASRGNAGAYAFSDILPLASPGILRQAPRWLLDPLGPLAIRPAYLPRIAPWLWRFWRASQPAQVIASTAAQAALMDLSARETPNILEAAGALSMLRSDGNLHLYQREAQWRAALPSWQLRARYGIAFEHLHGAAAIARLQTGLSAELVAATFVPAWRSISDPLLLTRTLASAFEKLGGRVRQAKAVTLHSEAAAVRVTLDNARQLVCKRLVVAAGAWSHQLAMTLGERIPLETERGYNTSLPPGAFPLQRQLTFPGHGFVITAIAGGVRVGGAVEFAGLEAPPNYRRAEAMLSKAKRFLPELNCQGATQWMGFRPSLPDSLPVIGRSASDGRVIYAFGHGHLGLTQSAATARLVAEIIAGSLPGIDLAPFSALRFSRATSARCPMRV